VTPIERHERGEDGAVAMMAAVLFIVFAVLAAFTVDFGMAYTARQRLQVATDAGSLAAAQVFKGRTESCSTLRDSLVSPYPTLRTQAQVAADTWAAKNDPDATGRPIQISCTAGQLGITYSAETSSPTTFGGLAGAGQEITLSRGSASMIGEAEAAVGSMRPWGICSGVINTSTLGQVVFVPTLHGATSLKDSSTTICGDENPPGGWWVAQCVGQGNGNGQTEATVAAGCPTSTAYQAVSGQSGYTTPATLYNYLTSKCPSKTVNATCLSSDQGNNFHNASDEWQVLVGKTFTMPVFCTKPTCSHMAVAGSGNNASYAIQRLATVELCGYEFQPRTPSTGWPTTGPCATANAKGYQSGDVINGGGFFLIIKSLTGGPTADWKLNEFKKARLTQ
jgi:hypothetical protein